MINLKIGKYEYEISPNDRFMDNGACIQLMTQSKEPSRWGRRSRPVMSNRAVKEIAVFKREIVSTSELAVVFSLSGGGAK